MTLGLQGHLTCVEHCMAGISWDLPDLGLSFLVTLERLGGNMATDPSVAKCLSVVEARQPQNVVCKPQFGEEIYFDVFGLWGWEPPPVCRVLVGFRLLGNLAAPKSRVAHLRSSVLM